VKLCECGCGNPAPIATHNCTKTGASKGQPLRFINGHANRGKAYALKHGMSHSPEYACYMSAKNRCTNTLSSGWKDYGGRGIEFRFTSFEEFFAELGPKPSPEHSIDRKDNDGHYEPGNVRWATQTEQMRNQRPYSAERCAKRSTAAVLQHARERETRRKICAQSL
jgi:hypothetical protein